jgi:hypothetical protein
MLGSEVRGALRQIQTELQRIIARLEALDAALAAGRLPPRRSRRT